MELNHIFIGNPAAKTIIIFLHEGLGSIKQWKDFPEKLCASTDSYGLVYDRSGYGGSKGSLLNRKADYLHLAAEELEVLIRKHVPSVYEIILYGHSDGGSIALIYASRHPTVIAGLITEAAHVFVEEKTRIGVKEALIPFNEGKFKGLKKYHGHRYKEVFMTWNSIWLDVSFRDWSITSLLPLITCPQLIIQGVNDQYGTLKQVETIEANTYGKTQTFMPSNCNHAPHKECAAAVLKVTGEFITNLG